MKTFWQFNCINHYKVWSLYYKAETIGYKFEIDENGNRQLLFQKNYIETSGNWCDAIERLKKKITLETGYEFIYRPVKHEPIRYLPTVYNSN